jgi:AbrB family looped-hinge helix DNA binding protein
MDLSHDKNEVQRRLTPKGQVTLPGEVRKALGLRPGDSVVFEINDGKVTIRRADNLDPFFHLPIFQALEEWSQDQKATVFRYP